MRDAVEVSTFVLAPEVPVSEVVDDDNAAVVELFVPVVVETSFLVIMEELTVPIGKLVEVVDKVAEVVAMNDSVVATAMNEFVVAIGEPVGIDLKALTTDDSGLVVTWVMSLVSIVLGVTDLVVSPLEQLPHRIGQVSKNICKMQSSMLPIAQYAMSAFPVHADAVVTVVDAVENATRPLDCEY
jgi:hypothetical protein